MLAGRTAVITGASGGIGFETVRVFCNHHARVFAFVRRRTDGFKEQIESLNVAGANVMAIECDFSKPDRIKNAVRELGSYTKTADILVNNAAVGGDGASFHMQRMDWIKEAFKINFFSMTVLTQYISRMMLRKTIPGGSIVNVTSVSALHGILSSYEYASSKAAIIGATKELAIELGKRNIRVNAIAPGLTDTRMAAKVPEQFKEHALNSSIMKRLARPEEIANAVLFLASDMSSYMTGQVLQVDGGIL